MLTMLKTCLVRQGLEEDGDEGVKVRFLLLILKVLQVLQVL